MNYGIEIKDTESCPWNNNKGYVYGGCGYRQFRDKEAWQHYECTGIGSKHCPLTLIEPWRLESCETCKHYETDHDYPLSPCPNEFYDYQTSEFPFNLHNQTTCDNWEAK